MQHQNGSSILIGTQKKGNQKGINTKGKGSHYFSFNFNFNFNGGGIDFTDTKRKGIQSFDNHNQNNSLSHKTQSHN